MIELWDPGFRERKTMPSFLSANNFDTAMWTPSGWSCAPCARLGRRPVAGRGRDSRAAVLPGLREGQCTPGNRVQAAEISEKPKNRSQVTFCALQGIEIIKGKKPFFRV